MSSTAHESWRVRVCDRDGVVHGAGVLVTHEYVLTCAHVVAAAVGADPAGSCPSDPVVLDFPGSSSNASVPARPLRAGWAAVQDQRGDVAVLTLEKRPPGGVRPAALRACGSPYPHSVRAFGHPRGVSLAAGSDVGRWISAGLLGSGGPGAEWIQMVGDHVTGGAVDSGFSGAGVVADDGAVIGCVIAYDVEPGAKIAWMVPVEIMASYWNPLAGMIQLRQEPAQVMAGERHRLITLLFAVTEMRNAGARDTYLSQLQRQYQRLAVNRSRDDFQDVGAIVDGCLREPGALHDLVRALEVNTWSQADAGVLAQLREVLSTLLPAPLLHRDEREHLLTLLRNAAPTDIADSFRDAIGPFGSSRTGPPDNPAAAIAELEARNTSPGAVHPLIEFAERVARRLAEPQRGQMWQWSDRVAARLGIGSSMVLPLRSRLGRTPAEVSVRPAYFVTRLEPDAIDSSRYLLTIWLQHGTDPGIPVRQEETSLALDEILQLVSESFSRAAAYAVEEVGLLTLEFVLPAALLSLPVDQWQMGTSSLPHGIGVDHPVLLRSFERRGSLRLQDVWRRNDEWLRRNGSAPAEPALTWVTTADDTTARRMHASLVRPGPPAGVVFSFIPAQHLAIGIEAGAVALLWSRATRRSRSLERGLRDFLAQVRIGELPEAVWQYRMEAAGSPSPEEHLGSSIALFWDRYDRYPEEPRLYRAPSVSRGEP